MLSRNRLGVINNIYQGTNKKILCVCSAGCLRSPTAAHILSADPFNFNTRAAGVSKEYAIVHADLALVTWADEIVAMDEFHAADINRTQQDMLDKMLAETFKPVHILDIEDSFGYRDPKLVQIMTDKFYQLFKNDLKV